MPSFTNLAISPGGKYFAARYNAGNRYMVSVFEITGSGAKYVYGFREEDTLSIDWFRWVSQDHLLQSVAYTAKRRARGIVQTSEKRLVSLNAATAEATGLFRTKAGESPIQIQDNIVSFLPDDPTHVLVQYSRKNPAHPDVYRVDVTKMTRHAKVIGGRRGVRDWIADTSGEIRLGVGVKNEKDPYLAIREKGKKKWENFSHRVENEKLTFRPLAFSGDPNKLYVVSNHEGDPLGLYLFDIQADEFGPLIYKHSSVDISSVNIEYESGVLLSLNFVADEIATRHFSRRPIRKDIDRIHEQFPETNLTTHSVSDDGNHAVLRVAGEQSAGTYLLYSRADDRILKLPPQYPDLEGIDPGRTFASEYAARDGLVIPAYVTLPPQYDSLEQASGIPFIVHPHGGPGARDLLRFSYDVQFLASLGYGVLQMNFRGSTGYGQEFKDAGDREWGQAMQDDITDGVSWLIEKGYANAEQIAIVGASYGGYAALMGAAKTPDLYKCAISFAGVTDLPDLLRYSGQFIDGRYRTRFIGNLWRDRKMLAENSPARRVKDIKVPILLMHGNLDNVVDIKQSEKMVRQLQKHEKVFRYVEFMDGTHYLSLYQNRLRYLQEMETFLGDCLN